MATLQEIDEAVRTVGRRFDGFSGNCARFATVLNRVLEAGGDYVIVDGGHYEYVDHVLVRYRNRLFDASGMVTGESLRSDWCEDGETVESFRDDSEDGSDVRRLVDRDAVFAAAWDEDDLEEALRAAMPMVAANAPRR